MRRLSSLPYGIELSSERFEGIFEMLGKIRSSGEGAVAEATIVNHRLTTVSIKRRKDFGRCR